MRVDDNYTSVHVFPRIFAGGAGLRETEMRDQNCYTCKVPERKRGGEACRNCEVVLAQGGSCSGVKYPCNFDCEECMFERVYSQKRPRREAIQPPAA
jgi:hypothetical protein